MGQFEPRLSDNRDIDPAEQRRQIRKAGNKPWIPP
jgi:hypothetical protein